MANALLASERAGCFVGGIAIDLDASIHLHAPRHDRAGPRYLRDSNDIMKTGRRLPGCSKVRRDLTHTGWMPGSRQHHPVAGAELENSQEKQSCPIGSHDAA